MGWLADKLKAITNSGCAENETSSSSNLLSVSLLLDFNSFEGSAGGHSYELLYLDSGLSRPGNPSGILREKIITNTKARISWLETVRSRNLGYNPKTAVVTAAALDNDPDRRGRARCAKLFPI